MLTYLLLYYTSYVCSYYCMYNNTHMYFDILSFDNSIISSITYHTFSMELNFTEVCMWWQITLANYIEHISTIGRTDLIVYIAWMFLYYQVSFVRICTWLHQCVHFVCNLLSLCAVRCACVLLLKQSLVPRFYSSCCYVPSSLKSSFWFSLLCCNIIGDLSRR